MYRVKYGVQARPYEKHGDILYSYIPERDEILDDIGDDADLWSLIDYEIEECEVGK